MFTKESINIERKFDMLAKDYLKAYLSDGVSCGLFVKKLFYF